MTTKPHRIKWTGAESGRCKKCGARLRIVERGPRGGRVLEWYASDLEVWMKGKPPCGASTECQPR